MNTNIPAMEVEGYMLFDIENKGSQVKGWASKVKRLKVKIRWSIHASGLIFMTTNQSGCENDFKRICKKY